MSIVKREYYTQKNGIDIIKAFDHNGNFMYIDREDEDILDNYTFTLVKAGGSSTLLAPRTSIKDRNNKYTSKSFSQMLNYKYNNTFNIVDKVSDHINGVEIDNTKNNIRIVTVAENSLNQFNQGYTINFSDSPTNASNHTNYFATIKTLQNGKRKIIRPFRAVRTEKEAALNQAIIEEKYINKNLSGVLYTSNTPLTKFNFFVFRRLSQEILDKERKGILSEQEATLKHILKFSNNIWYYYRYNLDAYYNANNIRIPTNWKENSDGRLIYNNGKLCSPFKRGIKAKRINY